MARVYEWQKKWMSVEDPRDGFQSQSPSSLDKETAVLQQVAETVSSHSGSIKSGRYASNSVFSTGSASHLEVDDDDNLSSVSTLKDQNFFGTVQRLNQEALFAQILDWLAKCTGSAFKMSTGGPRKEDATSTAKMYRIMDDGFVLVALVRKACLVRGKLLAKKAPKTNDAQKLSKFNFELFRAVCTSVGLPSQYIVMEGDRDNRRIVGCFALLSRCCRSNNKEILPLTLSAQMLNSIGIRIDEITLPKPHPSLQEMQLQGTFWVPDSFTKACMLCESQFSFFNRYHHCRQCGMVCCATCSPHRERCLGYQGKQRVCLACYQQRKADA